MTERGGERGQINFDFAVGVSILIVAVILAFSLVPSVFGGVTEGGQQSDEVVADRIAADLVGSMSQPGEPGSVDIDCLRAFYSGLDHCGYGESSVTDNLDLENRFVNVRVLGDTDGNGGVADDQLYWDDNAEELTEITSGNLRLAGGDDTTNAQQVGTSRRAVTIDGTPVRIIVRVW